MYALWRLSILPIITTAPVAIESLLGGSDLFIPGIFTISSLSLTAGSAVAIASTKSPTVPLAVGRLLLDAKDIKEDDKGKAVRVLHTWKDTLWLSGSKVDPPSDLKPLQKALEEQAEKTSDAPEPGAGGQDAIEPAVDVAQLSLEDADHTEESHHAAEAPPMTAFGTC